MRHAVGVALTIVTLAACDDSTDPRTGTSIGTNATATLDEVPAGDLEVRLTGLRGNCAVQGPHPRLIRVTAGG